MASAPFDLVIRNGTIIDGSGGDPYKSDVAVRDGLIVAVGTGLNTGVEEVDAAGLVVTPGFVDIHTHYDGQVTWESNLMPSSAHGVTTVVTGNCGVGFAPCRPEDHDQLIELMAGVEDIPEVVMTEGLDWTWTTFGEYLDAVDRRPHDVDVAAMLPHSALRVYVMGDRAARRESATAADISAMAELTREAVAAGAIGFGTSRALHQQSARGESIPTVRAAEEELRGILGAMPTGVFQALSDFYRYEDIDGEFAMFRRLVAETGRPMSFTVDQQFTHPEGWRTLLALTEQANDDGLPIKAQVIGRPGGILLGLELTRNPFDDCPSYLAIAHLPLNQRVAELRRPEVRERILAEALMNRTRPFTAQFEITDPPDYEPDPATDSLAARAATAGTTPQEIAYDIVLKDDGHGLIRESTVNYVHGSLDACYEMVTHKDTLLGLGDGGAHLGLICDASYPTTMLSLWARDRTRGPQIPLPQAVKALTADTSHAVGLRDRGRIGVGYKADLNVIDHERVGLRAPRVVHDLPAGGRRIVQPADGYVATFVSGVATQRNGKPTGAMPGRMVRGPQVAPTAEGSSEHV